MNDYTSKFSTYSRLFEIIQTNIIDSAGASYILPCRVEKRNGIYITAKILLETTGGFPLLEDIPIIQGQYFNTPITAGDIGLLIQSSVLLDKIIREEATISNGDIPCNLTSYFFLPLIKVSQYKGKDEETYLSSKTHKSSIILSDSEILLDTSKSSIILSDSDILLDTSKSKISFQKLLDWLENYQKNYNKNMQTQTTNNSVIQTALSGLGAVVTLTPLEQFQEPLPIE